jgi:hypothetical protein
MSNVPPYRPRPTRPEPPPNARARLVPIVPANVLRALIGQSRKRCEAYVEMMRKFGAGLKQLDLESRQMLAQRRNDPESARQLEEYFAAVRAMAEQSEQHVAQQIHYEVQFQGVLQAWLYGRDVAEPRDPEAPRPRSLARPAPPRAPLPRPAPPAAPPRAAPRGPAVSATLPPKEALTGYAAFAAKKLAASAKPAPSRPQALVEKPNGPAARAPEVEETLAPKSEGSPG